MWEKIKNAFKWIADHTGISWIARKISSGWKWLFGGKKSNDNQQSVPKQPDNGKSNGMNGLVQGNDKSRNTTPKTPVGDDLVKPSNETLDNTNVKPPLNNQPPVDPQPSNPKDQVNGQSQGGLTNGETTPNHLKITDNSVTFELTEKAFEKCKTYKNPHNGNNKNEVFVYITCNGSEYHITGIPSDIDGIYKVDINSIAKVKDGVVNDKTIVSPTNNMEGVKELLNANAVSCEESIAVTHFSSEPSKKDKIVVLTNNKIGKKLVASGNLSEPTDFQGSPPTSETLLKQVENGRKLSYTPQLSEFLRKEAKKDLGRIITFDKVVPSSSFTNTKTENPVIVDNRSVKH